MSSTARLACASFCASLARSTTFVLAPCCGSKDGELPIATAGWALAISLSCFEVAPKLKIGVRMLSETVRADARQGDIGIQSIASIIEGTPAITITLPIQKPADEVVRELHQPQNPFEWPRAHFPAQNRITPFKSRGPGGGRFFSRPGPPPGARRRSRKS